VTNLPIKYGGNTRFAPVSKVKLPGNRSTQWMSSNPSYLLADHFGKPQAVFEKFPKGRAFISPPDGQGQREIK